MRILRGIVGASLLAMASTAALAFQEQQVGGAAGAKSPAAAVVTPEPAAPISIPVPAAPGTEIRIPGLGRLGVIPKLDFGLELLYGANDVKRKVEEKTEQEDSQVLIRGTLKRKF